MFLLHIQIYMSVLVQEICGSIFILLPTGMRNRLYVKKRYFIESIRKDIVVLHAGQWRYLKADTDDKIQLAS